MKTLGLDLSSTVCGYAISENKKIIDAGFIDISKHESYKDKANAVVFVLKTKHFDKIQIEETLANFSFGRTSQQTILKLAMNKAVICYVLEEEFKLKIVAINVNTMRKHLFGKCRIKGMKPKDFVRHHLELIIPDIKKFIVKNKRDGWDERNSDMYDAIVCAMYDEK